MIGRYVESFGRVAAVVVVVGLGLGGCTTPARVKPAGSPLSNQAPTSGFAPGADGIGDAYYPKAGNGGYDAVNYVLDLRYDPGSDKLTGTATITARATSDLSRFNLDLSRVLKAGKVIVDEAPARAEASGDELVVTPVAGIATGTQFVVMVEYGGVAKSLRQPEFGGYRGFLHTVNGAVAMGEPEVAALWFPVNDHPRDKATYTIRVAAPAGLTVLSNGVMKGKRSSDGWTTWTWVESKPMASYLATIVIGKYRVKQSTHDGVPVVLAVDASLPRHIDAQLARTSEVIDFLESMFGPYPFDAMGGIVIADGRIHFALENQTRPIYPRDMFAPGRGDPISVIVHELAHQWYGDSVSVDSWKEIWLNEGFATYAAFLWQEKNGRRTAQQTFDTWYQQASEFWAVAPGNPGVANLFHESVYIRGAMTLHALRVTVGDSAFFSILREWASEKAHGNASTAEFIALAERISGRQLDRLFQDWLYGTTRPTRPSP